MATNGETIELLGDAGADAGRGALEEDGSAVADTSIAEPDEEPEPLSKEAVKQRRGLVRRIARYKAVFPELLGELASELEGLIHKSPEELATLLEEVQFLVETRRSTAQARGLFLAGLSMGEAVGPHVGLKLTGLALVASRSDELLTSVDEVALKYEGVVQLDPLARLAMAVGQLVLAVDGANRAREANVVVADSQHPVQPRPRTCAVAEPSPPANGSTVNIKRHEYSDL
jgi:hypothetical protein